MKEKIIQLINKGERGLEAARRLCEEGDYDFSASRAYYAMFHMTEALLLTKKLTSSRHSGVLALFYEHFVKLGILPLSLHKDLHYAMEMREQGDYWSDSKITAEKASDLLQKAGQFVLALKKHFK